MAGLHFDITGDNSNFIRKLHECENGVRHTSRQIEQSGLGIEELFNRMAKAAAAFGAGFTAKEFITNVAQVRGEFQQLEVAFKTMLGSEENATALMQQLVKTAATTPFDLQGVADGAKQLLAYGENVENVNDDLVRLGNIAAGLSQPLGDIVYLYGTTMTQGRLYTQDLNQFTGRGIPMIRELAKQFGVAENEVKGLVEAGKVGFPEVQKVIMSLTNEGGMFFNLMQEQSKTITGQISNIEDSISTMFNEIGKANEGIINNALSGVSYLAENYEKVGRTLIELVGTYGAYKAALIALSAIENLRYQAALAHMAGLTNMQAIMTVLKEKTLALNKAMLANPYVMVAAAITTLGYGLYKLATYEDDAEKAQRKLNDAMNEYEKASINEHASLARLKGELSSLTAGTDEYNQVKEKIVRQFGKYYDGLDNEISKVGLTEEAYNKLTIAINKSFGARQYEKFSSQQQDELSNTMSENLGKIQERLYDKLGNETGAKIYAKIREGIISGSIKSGKGLFKLSGFDEEVSSALDKVSSGVVFSNRAIEGYITNILNAQKVTDELDKKARERFGIEGEVTQTSIVNNADSKEETRNKEYWETRKKEAEDARDALDVSKKNSEEWDKYTRQIQEAQAQIDKYSSSSKRHDNTNKEKEEQLRKQEQLSEQLLSLRRKNQQNEINLMKEGTQKKLAQIDLDYQKELDAIRKQEDEWSKANNGKLTDEQSSQINLSYSQAESKREKSVSDVNKEEMEAQRKAWQEYFIEFGNYQDKRKNLIEKYNDEIAKLQEESPERATKEAEKNRALEQLDEQYGKSTKAMADLFEDASNKSVSSIQAIIDKYEALVEYMSGTNSESVVLKDIGFTDRDIEKIEKGEISIKDVTDAIKGLKQELKGKSPFSAFKADLSEAIDKLKKSKGDTDIIGEGLEGIGNAVVGFIGPLKEFSSNIGNIFGFDDSKIQGAIDAVGGLGQTAAGVGQIMSGDVIGGAMSVVSGISSVVSAVEGMFGADYSRYNQMVDEYNTLNDIWDELIDKKKEYIDISYGEEANKVGKEALELAEKSIESYRILGRERLNAGSSAGSHSIGVRIRKGMSNEGWAQARKALGADFDKATEGRMTGLFDLSVEQISKLKEADIFWSKLDDDVRKYLQGIIDGEERIADIQNQVKEQLTQTSFDSVFDSFVDTLMNMDSKAEDFSKDFERYLQRAILTTMVGDKYKGKLQAWYDSFAKANEDKAGITKEEMDKSQAEWDAIVQEAITERDKLKDVMGWTGEGFSQSSSKGYSTTIRQDTGEEISGRLTAVQVLMEEMKNQIISVTVGVDSLVSISTDGNKILSDILTQYAISNGYLEDIAKYTKPILEFGDKFDKMISAFNKL